jgi:hypothetical protein
VGFGLLEDVGEGVQSLLGVEDGGVVECVAHDGRIECGMWYGLGIVNDCVMGLICPRVPGR